jgi:hypothetical protein
MTTLYSQVGGCRVGRNFWRSFNASWPFATFEIHADRLVIAGFWRTYEFPRSSVVRLSDYDGLFSSGVRIEHSIAAYPPLVVFWTRDRQSLREKLSANAFPVSTSAA